MNKQGAYFNKFGNDDKKTKSEILNGLLEQRDKVFNIPAKPCLIHYNTSEYEATHGKIKNWNDFWKFEKASNAENHENY